jgi:hypothetical protein
VLKGLVGPLAIAPPAQAAPPATAASATAAPALPHAYRPIEAIRVGQRVITDLPEGILDIDCQPFDRSLPDGETRVDPATWRLIRMRAESIWEDGTLDDINIETLQPLEWIETNSVRDGADVPIPLDLVEMGLPEDLQANVLAIESCPNIEPGPGRVVLMTVNHLNNAVVELTVSDGSDGMTTIRSTASHRFYSDSKDKWVTAAELAVDEVLAGGSALLTIHNKEWLEGTHRVYNFTVECDHVYRVSHCGVLAHNTCHTPDQRALLELVDEATLGGRRSLTVDQANAVLDLADEVALPGVRASATDVAGAHGPFGPHIHIPGAGRGGHVPVQPGVPPRIR